MKQKPTNRILAIVAIVASLALPFYSGGSLAAQRKAQQKKPPAINNAGKVIELRNIDQLKETFQHDTGKIRLVTILSPT